MKIAIIDDSEYKIKDLVYTLKDFTIFDEPLIARSFQGAIKIISLHKPEIVLLDMSIPTSERAGGILEGRVRVFGGKDIMSEISFMGLSCRVIIVTQFDRFGQPPHVVERNRLFDEIAETYGKMYIGGVYYDSVDKSWEKQLKKLLQQAIILKER